jgi:hypothetical protein
VALNPAGERKIERFGWVFAPGDKVMQIENDYDKEVYNGDIGYVVDVDPDASDLTASFDGRSVTYGLGELDTLVPAYAVTIHKNQGSEYPAVVIPVLTPHYAMLQRNLLYTGITRGKSGAGRPEEGCRYCRAQRLRPSPVVEAARIGVFNKVGCIFSSRRTAPVIALDVMIMASTEFAEGGASARRPDARRHDPRLRAGDRAVARRVDGDPRELRAHGGRAAPGEVRAGRETVPNGAANRRRAADRSCRLAARDRAFTAHLGENGELRLRLTQRT